MWKNIKNVYKIRIQRDLFETCKKNGQSDKDFLLTSNVCPQGVFCPCHVLYTCIKSLKMCIKSDLEKIILKLAIYGQREKAFLLSSKFWPNGLSARGYIRVVKHEKNVYKIGLQSNFFLNLQQMGKVIRAFC